MVVAIFTIVYLNVIHLVLFEMRLDMTHLHIRLMMSENQLSSYDFIQVEKLLTHRYITLCILFIKHS